MVLDVALATCLLAFAAWADTTARLHGASVGTCYCGCAMSKTAGGCEKMCDLPKFAARRWAVTCAKPREELRVETPEAGPHLRHPSRAERASN